MDRSLFSRQNWKRDGLMAVGWFVVVGLAIALVWYSFRNEPAASPSANEPDAGLTGQPQLAASPTYILLPTATLTPTPQALPSPTPAPTAIPPTPTPTPYIVAGADGVNVRTGPGTNHGQVGYIDPDGQADFVGTEGDWVQIRYDGEIAYVYGPLVTIVQAQGAEAPAPLTTPSPTGEIVAWSEELARLINQQRAAQGLPAYTYSEPLKQAALLHAVDCAERGELTHIGSDGSTLSVRVGRAGYGSVNVSEITVSGSTPQSAIEWWMGETPPNDPHRSQVLSATLKEMGVAVVAAGSTYYFVAVFGRP